MGYNFDPLNLSFDPLIFVGRVHRTHSNNFQNESLNLIIINHNLIVMC